MLKKMVVILLAALCMMSFVSCTSVTDTNNDFTLESSTQTITPKSTSDASVSATDRVILHDVDIYDNYAVLPLCDVITDLGFQLTWDGTDRATFYCNEIKYEISISEKTLTKAGDNVNYLICAPGNKHFVCDVVDGVLVVDDNTFICLFNTFIDYSINVFIDRDNNSVIVTKR